MNTLKKTVEGGKRREEKKKKTTFQHFPLPPTVQDRNVKENPLMINFMGEEIGIFILHT